MEKYNFDFEEFKKAIEDYYSFRKECGEYDSRSWKIDSSNKNCLASRCSEKLKSIGRQIENLCKKLNRGNFQVRPCRGASIYPRNPWIGIFFNNEKATDGVYPFLSLCEDGLVVGCVESLMEPQESFSSNFGFTQNAITEGRDENDALYKHVDVHYSRETRLIPASGFSETDIEKAFATAIDVYEAYNKQFPKRSRKWCKIKKIKKIDELIQIVRQSDKNRKFAYRGQGDSAWKLESGLGRSAHPGGETNRELDMQKIIDFEQESMGAFMGEIARLPEYHRFRGVDLLALMQHYGSKTRLLDFSFSPLIALYMAIDQYDAYLGNVKVYQDHHSRKKGKNIEIEGIALWRVDVDCFMSPASQRRDECNAWWAKARCFNAEATRILRAKLPENIDAGIDVIVPATNSTRSSAQEGLFLMPKRMSESFQSNMNVAVNKMSGDNSEASITEYIIPVSLIDEARELLRQFCITPKLIYPDLTGLAKSINGKLNLSPNKGSK